MQALDQCLQEGICRQNFRRRTMSDHNSLKRADQDHLDAVAFRRFLDHLAINTDVQNIDLMILADFCRNCLSKWYKAAADGAGLDVSMDEARERIYGMPYAEWKNRYQTEATTEQLAAFEARRINKEQS
jgi:hypothetical protein